MQKTKTIDIGEKSFTLKELKVKVVWDIIQNEDDKENIPALDQARDLLKLACPELTKEALLDLYPSEIAELWEGFKEVNSDFLEIARKMGLLERLIEAVCGAATSSIKLFAFSLQQAMGRKSGNMASGFFSRLLKR